MFVYNNETHRYDSDIISVELCYDDLYDGVCDYRDSDHFMQSRLKLAEGLEKAYIEIKGNDIYVVDYYYGIKKEKHFFVSDITAAEILSGRSFKVKGFRIQQCSYIVLKKEKKYLFKIICLPETKELFQKYL